MRCRQKYVPWPAAGALCPRSFAPVRFDFSELSPQEGEFSAYSLWPGRYRVRADLSGYNSQQKILELEEGQEAKLEFTFEG